MRAIDQHRLSTFVLLGVIAAACGSGGEEDESVRPNVPAGWQMVQPLTEDIRVFLPPQFELDDPARDPSTLSSYLRGENHLEVLITGPAGHPAPPDALTVDGIAQWMAQFRTGPGLQTRVDEYRVVELPLGTAVERRAEHVLGHKEPTTLLGLLAYGIATEAGFVLVYCSFTPPLTDEVRVQLELIPRLIEFP